MKLQKKLIVLLLLLLTAACDYMPRLDEVIPDRRTEYKKSEAMPDLEVPPDLTVTDETDPLLIPSDEASTLSQYENQKKQRGTGKGGAIVSQGDEQWLTVQGGTADIWPKLKEFWEVKGYTLDLDDQELGVMETDWLETGAKEEAATRIKFNIIAETGSTTGSTVLFLSSQRQEKSSGEDGKENWSDIASDVEIEKRMLGELNLHFYGKPQQPAAADKDKKAAEPAVETAGESAAAEPAPAPASTKPGGKPRAEILSLGDGKAYLSLPEEFNRAWGLTETAILDAGMIIENQEREKGLYHVTYSGPKDEEKKEGWLSKLKFWGGGDERPYLINLTGVGEKTELVVLNENGEWAEPDETTLILNLLQGKYNAGR